MTTYKVSVIIPIYGVEEFIECCAHSLMQQTMKDVEYIFVDDCTPDNSIAVLDDVLKQYPERADDVKILHHEHNRGLTCARNTGLKEAAGDFVIHIDSDDWIAKDMIEQMYNKAVTENADAVICDFSMAFDGKEKLYKTIDWTDDKVLSMRKYLTYTWNMIWNILVKRELYTKYNLKSLEGHSYGEDFNLTSKLLLHADKVVHLPKSLYFYRQNDKSIMHNLNDETTLDQQIMVMDLIKYYREHGVYDLYEKELCWRVMKSNQDWVLSKKTYSKFLNHHPDCFKYIWSCPFTGNKIKIMMWLLSNHYFFINNIILYLRNLKNRIFNIKIIL